MSNAHIYFKTTITIMLFTQCLWTYSRFLSRRVVSQ